MQRLVKKGEIIRVSTGIYVRPEIDPVIGVVTPGIEEVARAIAKRDKARIVPTGNYAIHKLGLSTQIPLNVVFLTDGAARKVKVDKRVITFKKATPKTVSTVGEINTLAIQALRTIGKTNISDKEIEKIQELLQKEKLTFLEHDFRLAPVWIRMIIQPVIKKLQNEQYFL